MENNSEKIVFDVLDRYIKKIPKNKYNDPNEWTNDVFKNAENDLYDKMEVLNILNNVRSEFDYYVLRHF